MASQLAALRYPQITVPTTPSRSRRNSSLLRSPSRSKEINIILSLNGQCCDLQPFSTEETIKDVKLRLQSRPWFLSRGSEHTLMYGERNLCDNEKIANLANDNDYIHIFVKVSDIRGAEANFCNIDVSRLHSRLESILPSPPKSPGVSALTQALSPGKSSGSLSVPSPDRSLVPVKQQDPPARQGLLSEDAVVHLVVKRSATKVGWRPLSGGEFELSVSGAERGASKGPLLLESSRGVIAAPVPSKLSGCPASQPLSSYGIGKTSVLDMSPVVSTSFSDMPSGSPLLNSPEHELYQHWKLACAGLASGQAPTLANAGSGGSYFIKDDMGNNVAVFKPEDEEPLAANNPRGWQPTEDGNGLRRGILPGEGASREVAAFLLDHEHFAGVPPTELVEFSLQGLGVSHAKESKRGSLQQFVPSDGDCEEFGTGLFSVSQVHRICVLDLRLGNTDRNGGNLLARKTDEGWVLIPIDHGYCLPGMFQDINFEWMWWSQAREPFDEATRSYIARLDSSRDLAMLSAHGIDLRPECARVLRVCTLVLKKSAARGLTPFQMGQILCREGMGKNQSPIEKLHSRALKKAGLRNATVECWGEAEEAAYMEAMESFLDEYLEETLLDDVLV